MNTTRQFQNLKKKSIYLKLIDNYAREYLKSKSFRDRIDGIVEHRHKQLGFVLDDLPDLPFFDGCNQVSLSAMKITVDFSLLLEVKIINISDSNSFRAIYNLQNIEILTLSICLGVESIGKCPRLEVLEVSLCDKLESLFDLPALKVLKPTSVPY